MAAIGVAHAVSDTAGRRIAIVGAGQAGCQLALGLRSRGYEVTLVTDRDAGQVLHGRVGSAQCMFETAVDAERALGLARWDRECPPIRRVAVTVETGRTRRGQPRALHWSAGLDGQAQSIDQRVKLSAWIELFQSLGGCLRICRAGPEDLEGLAAEHDLVVVATGQDTLNALFPLDPGHSSDRPKRRYALTYLAAPDAVPDELSLRIMPGVGEISVLPALTTGMRCTIVMAAATIGGPMDRWADAGCPDAHLDRTHELLGEMWPEQASRLRNAPLTDSLGCYVGSLTATTRYPVGRLPSGIPVLGMADAILLTDPTTSGQGANTAAKAAAFYLERITVRGAAPFDEGWMSRVGDDFWRSWSRWVEMWSRSMADPLPQHVQDLLSAAAQTPSLAADVANALDDPARFHPWWYDDEQARIFITRHRRGTGSLADTHVLRRALGTFATGVTVVTTRTADGHLVGVTANSFTAVSLDPPLVLWCLAKSAASLRYFDAASHFAVNVLGAQQHHLSRRFATRGEDKFDGVLTTDGEAGLPMLEGVIAQFSCRRVTAMECGDHKIFIGRVEGYDAPGGEPLVFHSGHYRIATKHPDL